MKTKLRFSVLALAVIFFFQGNAFGQWAGGTNLTNPIYRNGSVATQGSEIGFHVASSSTDKSDWGGLWYGMSYGKATKFELDWSANATTRSPVLLQGFWGIGIRTDRGKITMGRNGIVAIGLSNSASESIADESAWHTYKLYVAGGIRTERIRVDLQNVWPDYVFEDNYELRSIASVASFIKENKHLPDVPSAQEIEKEGIDLAEMDAVLLRKVEELWLHVIELKEENEALKSELQKLKE